MAAKAHIKKFSRILLASFTLVSLLLLASCYSGGAAVTNANDSTVLANPAPAISLEQYLAKLSSASDASVAAKLYGSAIGNQQSFTAVAPIALSSITLNYFSDSACVGNLVASTLMGGSGGALLRATTYSSSDQSNYAICAAYPSGGCDGLLSAANGGMIKALQFKYTYSNGVSTNSACMYNISKGFEVLADYSRPAAPQACVSGGQCGYSQAYSSTILGLPSIATSPNFSCGLNGEGLSGNLSCWGGGESGQIGNNFSPPIPTLVSQAGDVTSYTQVSVNINFSCAIAGNGSTLGSIYCWGFGGSGQIGNGANLSVTAPTSVTMPGNVSAFSSLSTNSNFSCALVGSGSNPGAIYCWGVNSNGQIGNGSVSPSVNVPTPVVMPSGASVVTAFGAISTNSSFSCAIASASSVSSNIGKIYCWGVNSNGQIGIGSVSPNVSVPTPVTMPSGASAVTAFGVVSTNSSFSCAIASASSISSNIGKIYCWGVNSNGQIGIGSVSSNVRVPTPVTMPSGVTAFSQVATGSNFSCALASAPAAVSGKIYCWGLGTSGQIGNNGTISVSVPTLVTMPVGVTAFSQVVPSANFSCALASAGANAGMIYCWGANSNGQIGNGTTSVSVNVPTLASMPAGVTAFSQVATKVNFSCALASSGSNSGKIYCWGNGTAGQVGTGVFSNITVPTQVSMPSGVSVFTAIGNSPIGSNISFTCAIATTSSGPVYCWGNGVYGQIGNGIAESVNVKTRVVMPANISGFAQISSNPSYSCGLGSGGASSGWIYCWGAGLGGQIGNNLITNAKVPSAVNLPSGVSAFGAVSTNSNFSCALASSGINAGKVYCWGTGNTGQIGNGSPSLSVSVPTAVIMPSGASAVTAFGAISTNSSFSCALASASSTSSNIGKIYCWGANSNGQIGNGTTGSSVNVPTSVVMPSGVSAFGSVSTNPNFSCAVASVGANAGKIYCWGLGTSGQIGNNGTISVSVPTLVVMPSGVSAFGSVSTNSSFSCALASAPAAVSGKIYCWGVNSNGQIGNGTPGPSVNVPTSVSMPVNVTAFSQVASNTNFSCALASAGASAGVIYCWGAGSNGQIGNGSFAATTPIPTAVTMPGGVSSFGLVTTNPNFSCAIAASGATAGESYCWGIGTSGQLGNGFAANVAVPTMAHF